MPNLIDIPDNVLNITRQCGVTTEEVAAALAQLVNGFIAKPVDVEKARRNLQKTLTDLLSISASPAAKD